MHIPMEIIETVNLICGMLLEAPNLAKEKNYSKTNVINRSFRRLLDSMQKNVFYFSSESVRDQIYYATQELIYGNWEECYAIISKLNIWDSYTKSKIKENSTLSIQDVLGILKREIKISALITYIYTSKGYYYSYSI